MVLAAVRFRKGCGASSRHGAGGCKGNCCCTAQRSGRVRGIGGKGRGGVLGGDQGIEWSLVCLAYHASSSPLTPEIILVFLFVAARKPGQTDRINMGVCL